MFELAVLYGIVALSAIALVAVGWNAYSTARDKARDQAQKKLHARVLALQLNDYSEKFLNAQNPRTQGRRAANLAIERARELQYATLPEFGDDMVAVMTTYERLNDSQWRRNLLHGEQLGEYSLVEPHYESLRHDHALAVEVLLSRCESVTGPLSRRAAEAAPAGTQVQAQADALPGPAI